MFDIHKAEELKSPHGSGALSPGSPVVHVLDTKSYGIAIGVHGSLVDVLWTRPPLDAETITTQVSVPIHKPIEYITLTFKVGGDGVPDDVA